MCFMIWMLWRTMKKSKRDGHRRGSGFLSRLASRLPFVGKRSWQKLDGATVTGSPAPSYSEKAGSASAPTAEGFFGLEKAQGQPQVEQVQERQQQPQQAPLPITSDAALPQPPHPLRSNSVYQPQFYPSSVYFPPNALHIASMANNPLYSHQAQGSFSSTNAAQFGSVMGGDYPVSTLQSGTTAGPTLYYNPSMMTQQFPPTAAPYNPGPAGVYRQPSKATVSSLSSGFGDGDIAVSEPTVSAPPPVATANNTMTSDRQYTARFSWMSQAPSQGATQAPQSGRQSRRETVCTETSEDLPARFRSLTSWVDQQTGRIKRAQEKEREREMGDQMPPPPLPAGVPGIPGVHNPPPGEQSFGMMMDDEEMPRKVEETLVAAGRVG